MTFWYHGFNGLISLQNFSDVLVTDETAFVDGVVEKIGFNRLLHAEEKRDADAASALSYLCIKLFNDSLT